MPLTLLITERPPLVNLIIVFWVGLGLYSVFSSIAPAIMSELFPTELRGAGDRRLVQPHRRDLRRHGAAAHRGAGAGRPDLFFWYVSGGALIAFLIILTLPETKGRELT